MMRTPWPLAFAVVSAVHLIVNASAATPWDGITKCLLAPLLLVWVLRVRGPRILAVALVFCFFGDLFLTFSQAWFVPGMAAFALAHMGFITYFVSRGAVQALRQWWPAAIVYALAAIAVVIWLWAGLEPGLRVPVVVYAALLTSTATLALSLDRFAGFGAFAFLVSDAFIAMGEAEYRHPSSLWVMALYLLAIFYLTSASLSRERSTKERPRSRIV